MHEKIPKWEGVDFFPKCTGQGLFPVWERAALSGFLTSISDAKSLGTVSFFETLGTSSVWILKEF